jgi:uncharacterized phage-associated protein
MYNPITIANYFIKKSLETGVGDLTPMKLLKLVYISHGWYLGIAKKELINEGVQAWQYGPVIPSVYYSVKTWGKNCINQTINTLQNEIISEADKQFLDRVWNVYVNYNGLQLSSLTHQEGTPWYTTYHENGGINRSSTLIPNNLIKQHYEEIISRQSA